ncbi:hypothetical protein BKA70DRAFT_1489848 [Coprinopsis sp. MPI-PUGE-AT-0042]|nr:hypothetical protein BKA70DRAFT_1489848 [Coprinopsis sp. MPI-PUGE-AT-0042]
MVFQNLKPALITLAASGFASAMAVECPGDATCTFTVVASAVPSTGEVPLETEFNYCKPLQAQRKLSVAETAEALELQGATSIVTGPAPTNVYTVVKGFSVDDSLASDSEVLELPICFHFESTGREPSAEEIPFQNRVLNLRHLLLRLNVDLRPGLVGLALALTVSGSGERGGLVPLGQGQGED